MQVVLAVKPEARDVICSSHIDRLLITAGVDRLIGSCRGWLRQGVLLPTMKSIANIVLALVLGHFLWALSQNWLLEVSLDGQLPLLGQ